MSALPEFPTGKDHMKLIYINDNLYTTPDREFRVVYAEMPSKWIVCKNEQVGYCALESYDDLHSAVSSLDRWAVSA